MRIVPFHTVADQFYDRVRDGERRGGDTRPARGWYPSGSSSAGGVGGDVILRHDDDIGMMIHVAVCTDEDVPVWDQPLFMEQVGAITVPVNSQGKIGLLMIDRPVAHMNRYCYPAFEYESFGKALWEVPRGMPVKGERPMATARREAGEELGIASPMIMMRMIGELSPNTTYFPALQPVFLGLFDETRIDRTHPRPDVNEKIYLVDWVSLEEIDHMVRGYHIVCGMTLAALAMARLGIESLRKEGWIK